MAWKLVLLIAAASIIGFDQAGGQSLSFLTSFFNEIVAGGNNAVYNHKPAPDIRKALPGHIMSFDKEGRVVFLLEVGKWNFGKLLRDYGHRLGEIFQFFEQGVQIYADLSLRPQIAPNGSLYGPEGSATIVDLRGSVNDFSAPYATSFYIEVMSLIARVQKYMSYVIIINMSRRDLLLYQLLQRTLTPIGTGKALVFGEEPEKYIPAILKRISRDQVPAHLGGYYNFTYIARNGLHFNYFLQ